MRTLFLLFLAASASAQTTLRVQSFDLTKSSVNLMGARIAPATIQTTPELILISSGPKGSTKGVSGAFLLNLTNIDGMGQQIYNNGGPHSAASAMLFIANDGYFYNQPQLYIQSLSTQSGHPQIKLESRNPNQEFVETDQVAPAGRFEIDTNNDLLRFNSRNAANTSFEVSASMKRLADGGDWTFNGGIIGLSSMSILAPATFHSSASFLGTVLLNQTVTPTLLLSVGGTNTANFKTSATSGILGTVTSIPMAFYTNDTERARFTAEGDLQVDNALNVAGSASFSSMTATYQTSGDVVTASSTYGGAFPLNGSAYVLHGTGGKWRMFNQNAGGGIVDEGNLVFTKEDAFGVWPLSLKDRGSAFSLRGVASIGEIAPPTDPLYVLQTNGGARFGDTADLGYIWSAGTMTIGAVRTNGVLTSGAALNAIGASTFQSSVTVNGAVGTSGALAVTAKSVADADDEADDLVIGDGTASGGNGMTIYSATTGRGHILFADGTGGGGFRGGISYDHGTGLGVGADTLNFRTGGSLRGGINGDGGWVIGSGGTPLNVVSTSTWQPVTSGNTNLDSSAVFASSPTYYRLGPIMHMWGEFVADPTTTATETSFRLSVPVSSDFTLQADCGGGGGNSINESMRVNPNVANNTLEFVWTPVGTGAQSYNFNATCVIK